MSKHLLKIWNDWPSRSAEWVAVQSMTTCQTVEREWIKCYQCIFHLQTHLVCLVEEQKWCHWGQNSTKLNNISCLTFASSICSHFLGDRFSSELFNWKSIQTALMCEYWPHQQQKKSFFFSLIKTVLFPFCSTAETERRLCWKHHIPRGELSPSSSRL